MSMRIMACCLLIHLTFFQKGLAQPTYAIEGAWHRGHLIAHRPLVEGLRSDKIRGYEVSIYYRMSGKKQWHHNYKIPSGGIYAGWWNLGNKNSLGNSFSIIPFMDFKLTNGNKTSLGLKFGWGIGFIEKKFDAENNYKNVAIGSRINNSILLHPTFQYSISEKSSVKIGLSLTHYSNGSFESPNLGINLAAMTMGFTFGFGSDSVHKPISKEEINKKNETWIYGTFFAKEVAPPDGEKYATISAVAERMWAVSSKFSLAGGIDFFYDHSLSQRKNYDDKSGTLGLIRSGLHTGSAMHIGKTSLILNIGAYVYSGVKSESVFHRFGIRHNLNEKWTLLMHVKSHWGKADYMEFGVGMKLGPKNEYKRLDL